MSESHSHCEDAGTDTAVVGYLITNDRAAYSIKCQGLMYKKYDIKMYN